MFVVRPGNLGAPLCGAGRCGGGGKPVMELTKAMPSLDASGGGWP